MTVTMRRTEFELFKWSIAIIRAALRLILEHLDQMDDYATHIGNGGDPAERRRNLWLTERKG